jgi:hypothetical protein
MGVHEEAKVSMGWWTKFVAKGNLVESEKEFEARKRAIDLIISALKAGCTEEEFLKFRCPVCGGGLSLSVHPNRNIFFVRCKQSSIHMAVTDGVEVSVEWWASFVSRGWYSETPNRR